VRKSRKKRSKNKIIKVWFLVLLTFVCMAGAVALFKGAVKLFLPSLIQTSQADNLFNDKVEMQKAKVLSDRIVNDLVRGDYNDIYEQQDNGLKSRTKDAKGVASVLGTLFSMFGRPTEYVFKSSETGIKLDSLGKRSSAVFLYAVKTIKYPKDHLLKIEIVPSIEDKHLVIVGYYIIYFPYGSPAFLK